METPPIAALTFLYSILLTWILIWAIIWFLLSLLLKRQDIADVAWGLGIAALCWSLAALVLYDGRLSTAGTLALLFVTLWGLRLAIHIGTRLVGKKEDARYAAWRKEWGVWFLPRSFLQVFFFQGLLMLVIVHAPMAAISNNSLAHPLLVGVGSIVFLVGFLFEAIGDWQLRMFLKDKKNKGKIMTQGLWRYTRHPNYFGEVSLWWGIWLIAVGANPRAWWTIISPLLISFLILKVSGIPMLEKRWEGNKAFAKYKKETNAFFPGPVHR